MNTLIKIGSHELISLPEQGLIDVPAKIDTGADSSAIWASHISENNGVLSFCLFGEGSSLFSGETIKLHEYGVTRIKNSFGITEERYRAKLLVLIGGKKVRVEFSLADRSRNRYPVLIGKKTLNKRFLVDVSLNNIKSNKDHLRTLVLNSLPASSIKSFVAKLNEATQPKMSCDFCTYDDLAIEIDKNNKLQIYFYDTKKSLSEYDLIYFKTYFKKSEFASAVAEYAESLGIRFVDGEVASYYALTKLTQYVRLARYGIKVPPSILVSYKNIETCFDTFKARLGLPFVLKNIASEKGKDNYLVKSQAEFIGLASRIKAEKSYYIAQKAIANDGDYRVLVLDKTIDLVISRRSTSDSHINNTSSGGQAKLVNLEDFPAAAKTVALKAAILMNRQIAGVDLMQDKTSSEWYVLEVNNAPQLAEGAYLKEKLKIFASFLKNQAVK